MSKYVFSYFHFLLPFSITALCFYQIQLRLSFFLSLKAGSPWPFIYPDPFLIQSVFWFNRLHPLRTHIFSLDSSFPFPLWWKYNTVHVSPGLLQNVLNSSHGCLLPTLLSLILLSGEMAICHDKPALWGQACYAWRISNNVESAFPRYIQEIFVLWLLGNKGTGIEPGFVIQAYPCNTWILKRVNGRKKLYIHSFLLAGSLVLEIESLQHPVAAASQMAISDGASSEHDLGYHSSKQPGAQFFNSPRGSMNHPVLFQLSQLFFLPLISTE